MGIGSDVEQLTQIEVLLLNGLSPACIKPDTEVSEQRLGNIALELQVGIKVERKQVSLIQVGELPLRQENLIELRAAAVVQFFSDQNYTVEHVKRIGGVLASVGQEDRRFGHDRGGDHALAPVVDFVVMEPSFA